MGVFLFWTHFIGMSAWAREGGRMQIILCFRVCMCVLLVNVLNSQFDTHKVAWKHGYDVITLRIRILFKNKDTFTSLRQIFISLVLRAVRRLSHLFCMGCHAHLIYRVLLQLYPSMFHTFKLRMIILHSFRDTGCRCGLLPKARVASGPRFLEIADECCCRDGLHQRRRAIWFDLCLLVFLQKPLQIRLGLHFGDLDIFS